MFAWFSSIGFPDVKGRPLVRVATGDWNQSGDNPPVNHYVYGFLIREQGDDFEVFTPGLDTWKLHKTPARTPEYKRVGYEKADLAKMVTAYLRARRQHERPREPWFGPVFGRRLGNRTTAFILAWACWRNGRDDLAARLCNHAAGMKREWGNIDEPPPPLFSAATNEIALNQMWELVETFGNPKVTRKQLLERIRRFVRNYPMSKHQKSAKETVALLERMVKEDAEHARRRRVGKPFKQLGKEEQIAELIFQLRDQNGQQRMQPGACDIFDCIGGKDDTAAHKLVKIGYAAVPSLIEHLDDERFTRSIGFHKVFYFSHHVLRVNDCALAILEEIAGQHFWTASSTFSYMSQDKMAGETRQRVRAWYAVFKKKGEKGLLKELTERGDDRSAEMGRRLLKRYPKGALRALVRGARATKIGPVRANLVDLIASCNGEEPVQFILQEVKDGPLALPRLTAAEALHKVGRPEGLAAMIGWWQEDINLKRNDKKWEEHPASWASSIARFLANCGELKGIQTLAKDLHKHPVTSRLHVIAALSGEEEEPGFKRIPPRDPAKAAVAIEALLIHALDDREESGDSESFPETRVCDAAAHVLNRLYPKKYSFDRSAHPKVRDRQLVIMKNVWGSANRLPALPVPEVKRIALIPENTLRPLLDKYLAAAGDQRLAVRNKIEKLGLGVLPSILDRRDKASVKSEQAAWNDLAKRMSCIVAEVEVGERWAKPNEDPQKRLELLRGKPFDAKLLLAVMGRFLKDLPRNGGGIRVVAVRGGDSTGFSIRFDFTAKPKDAKGPPSQWGFSESVKIGRGVVYNQFAIRSETGLAALQAEYAELEEVLAQAYSAAPDKLIDIRIQIVAEWRDQ
jgi:hypothetical protein